MTENTSPLARSIERFREECWNNDWLRWIEEDDEHGGPYLDLAGHNFAEVTRQVAEAARLPEDWEGEWTTLGLWLRNGLDAEAVILPAILEAAAEPGYAPPDALEAFDAEVTWHDFMHRERARRSAVEAAVQRAIEPRDPDADLSPF